MSHPVATASFHACPDNIVTLLSDQVLVPITCDQCQCETEVSLARLKQQTILCEHCDHLRQFSSLEMRLLRLLLAQAGYRFSA